MLTEPEIQEYLDEIRKQVCSRCVERPPGGPPCAPLGKECGIETHLQQLIEAIHEVKSWSIKPYLDHNQEKICRHCELLNTDVCPCPLHYLAVLIVEAVETVDERHRLSREASALEAVETPVGC
jgi:ribosomal protein L40E